MQNITTLNKDIELQYSAKTNKYDLCFDRLDAKIIEGTESVQNAIRIAILTGFQELYGNPTFSSFGNPAYSLLKANQTKNTRYLLAKYIEETIKNIRRVETVDKIELTQKEWGYHIEYRVTTINDETASDIIDLKGGV